MVNPSLQTMPRGDDSEVQKLVKQMFVAPPGHIFVARDFAGIEAVLVGIEANSQRFTRLARLDIHSYFTAHNLYRQGVITAADLPDLKWSDADLKGYGKGIKARFEPERNIGKRCIHAGNYRVGPKLLHETYPRWFTTVKAARDVLNFFYDVFPEIDKWHERICHQVDKAPAIRNAFGHVHRFYSVLNWKKKFGKWEWDYGDDSKRLIAFRPQSNAALIGKQALKRCYYEYPDTMARWLRLFIHDENLCEAPIERSDEADEILKVEMEKPIPEMPLDPNWGFGAYLSIQTDPKRGLTWATMK
jgi:DNA polymerase I-like protein with 3'-5' exonuclease and polymerase domains